MFNALDIGIGCVGFIIAVFVARSFFKYCQEGSGNELS